MPVYSTGVYKNRSAERRKWLAHYKAKGCGSLKAEKLTRKKMRI